MSEWERQGKEGGRGLTEAGILRVVRMDSLSVV